MHRNHTTPRARLPTLAGDLRHRAPPLWHAESVTGQRVPAPLLVVMAIASVQTGSAVARTLFDDLGVAGTALLRLVIAATVLLALLRPPLRSWTRRQWLAALVLGVRARGHEPGLLPLARPGAVWVWP